MCWNLFKFNLNVSHLRIDHKSALKNVRVNGGDLTLSLLCLVRQLAYHIDSRQHALETKVFKQETKVFESEKIIQYPLYRY